MHFSLGQGYVLFLPIVIFLLNDTCVDSWRDTGDQAQLIDSVKEDIKHLYDKVPSSSLFPIHCQPLTHETTSSLHKPASPKPHTWQIAPQ